MYKTVTTQTKVRHVYDKVIFMIACADPWTRETFYMYEIEVYYVLYDISGQMATNPIYYRNAGNEPVTAWRCAGFPSFQGACDRAEEVFNDKVEQMESGLL